MKRSLGSLEKYSWIIKICSERELRCWYEDLSKNHKFQKKNQYGGIQCTTH